MTDSIRNALVDACRALLHPIALVLLRGGVTWREFAAVSKSVFVAVATEEFGIRGRPTNVSRVSILTGISRKEVKRQRELTASGATPGETKSTDATRLLSGWHQDEAFVGDDGTPLALGPKGVAPSFASLFTTYGGDTPEQTLVRELLDAGSIATDDSGRYFPLRRYHMPTEMDEGSIGFLGSNLFDHANTLCNNISGDSAPKRLEGFAVDAYVDQRHAEAFRQFIDARGQEFLEEIDDWLATHRVDAADQSATPSRLGLGIYGIEGPKPKGTPS